MVLIAINIFYIPIKLSFSITTSNSLTDFTFDQLPSWIFILDIVLKFNTAYYKGGRIHQKRKKILKHYLMGDFVNDLIIVVPFFISRFSVPFMDYILLLRVARLSSIFKNLEENTQMRDRFAALIDLGKLIYINIFVSHLCACAWHFIGVVQLRYYPSHDIWLVRQDIVNASNYTRYVYSFYWSTITIATVGYGDITPQTEIEMIFVIIMVLITSIVFGYTISSIGQIFAQIKEKNDKIRNQMAQMNNFIKKRITNPTLQMKVRKYFENYFKNEQLLEYEKYIEKLSTDLKKEVNVDVYKKLIVQSKLFENFGHPFLDSLCQYVCTQKYAPEQALFQEGDIADKLYILIEGEVRTFVDCKISKSNEKNEKAQFMRSFKAGQTIGTKSFIIGQSRNYCAKAAKFCEVAVLDLKDFKRVANQFPNEFEKYQMLKENIIFNPCFKKVIEVCMICSSNHNFINCVFTFYNANKLKLVHDRQKFSQKNLRFSGQVHNQTRNKWSFFYNKEMIQEKAICFALDFGLLKESEVDQAYFGMADDYNMSRLGMEKSASVASYQNQKSKVSRLSSEFNRGGGEESDEVEENNTVSRIGHINIEPIKTRKSVRKSSMKSSIMKPKKAKTMQQVSVSEYDFELQNQLDIIKSEYNRSLVEDKVNELDCAKNYDNYYVTYNLDFLLKKFESMSKSRAVGWFRDNKKLKTTIHGKMRGTPG